MKTEIRKVAWAFDAAVPHPGDQLRAYESFKGLFPMCKAKVYPIFVRDDSGRSETSNPMSAVSTLKSIASSLDQSVQKLEILSNESPPYFSERKVVRSFLRFVESIDADLIICSVNHKAGLAHYVDGTFTEILVEESDIPILMSGPNSRLANETLPILVPLDKICDFDSTLLAMEIAKMRGSGVHIFQSARGSNKQIEVAKRIQEVAKANFVSSFMEVAEPETDSQQTLHERCDSTSLIFASNAVHASNLVKLARRCSKPVFLNKPLLNGEASGVRLSSQSTLNAD